MRLIDADVLLNQLEDWRGDKEDLDMEDGHDVAYYSAMSRAMRFTKCAPAIDAVPIVHAQWRYKVAYAAHVHVTNIIYCTACGKGFHRIEGVDFNFCPNCGARMDGEKNAAD